MDTANTAAGNISRRDFFRSLWAIAAGWTVTLLSSPLAVQAKTDHLYQLNPQSLPDTGHFFPASYYTRYLQELDNEQIKSNYNVISPRSKKPLSPSSKQSKHSYIVQEFKKSHLPTYIKKVAPYIVWQETAYTYGISRENSAHAKGYWQFIPATAEKYGIMKKGRWGFDKRSDLKATTRATISYLQDNLALLQANSDFKTLQAKYWLPESCLWPLLINAHNCGEGHIENALHMAVIHGDTTKLNDFIKVHGKERGLHARITKIYRRNAQTWQKNFGNQKYGPQSSEYTRRIELYYLHDNNTNAIASHTWAQHDTDENEDTENTLVEVDNEQEEIEKTVNDWLDSYLHERKRWNNGATTGLTATWLLGLVRSVKNNQSLYQKIKNTIWATLAARMDRRSFLWKSAIVAWTTLWSALLGDASGSSIGKRLGAKADQPDEKALHTQLQNIRNAAIDKWLLANAITIETMLDDCTYPDAQHLGDIAYEQYNLYSDPSYAELSAHFYIKWLRKAQNEKNERTPERVRYCYNALYVVMDAIQSTVPDIENTESKKVSIDMNDTTP